VLDERSGEEMTFADLDEVERAIVERGMQ
jgi:hypothetical protein